MNRIEKIKKISDKKNKNIKLKKKVSEIDKNRYSVLSVRNNFDLFSSLSSVPVFFYSLFYGFFRIIGIDSNILFSILFPIVLIPISLLIKSYIKHKKIDLKVKSCYKKIDKQDEKINKMMNSLYLNLKAEEIIDLEKFIEKENNEYYIDILQDLINKYKDTLEYKKKKISNDISTFKENKLEIETF